MNIPKDTLKKLLEQWFSEDQSPEHIAQRAYDYALSQPVSTEPVAWRDKHNKFDLYVSNINQLDAEPLYTATQLAAARQQGAEEERKKWEADMVLHNNGVLRQRITDLEADNADLRRDEALNDAEKRIAELEQKNAVFLEALKRARDTAMKYTLVARIPECGHFGGIAQDLDYVYAAIAEVKS